MPCDDHPWITVAVRKRSIRITIVDFFGKCDLEIWWMTSKKTLRHLFHVRGNCVHYFIVVCEVQLELQSRNAHLGKNHQIGYLFYTNSNIVHHFIAIHELILELQTRNADLGQNRRFLLAHVTLKFDGWKKVGHFFCCPSSFVHYFITICLFELEFQSGNAQFRSKSSIFFERTLKFDRWS